MSTLSKLTVVILLSAGAFIPMQGCKNGPPPVMLARRLFKNKDQDLGAISQGAVLKLTKSSDGTATVGEDFKVSLASKSGDGQAWQCRTANDPYVLVDAASETDPAGAVSAGTEIHTLYHLHANAAGNAKIEFALVSTTDKNSSAKETITLEVEVKAAASK